MKLGELITALEDYKLHTIGVDEDTEVKVTFPEHDVSGEVDDVVVTVSRTVNRYTSRTMDAVMTLEVRSP